MSRFFKSAAFPILIVIVLAFFASKLISRSDQAPAPTFSGFLTQLDQKGRIDSVTLKTKDNSLEVVQAADQKKYEVGYPTDYAAVLVNKLRAAERAGDIKGFDVKPARSNVILSLLTYVLPFLIFIGFWIFLMNQVQGGGSKVMSFGKSRAKRMSVDSPEDHLPRRRGGRRGGRGAARDQGVLGEPEEVPGAGGADPEGGSALRAAGHGQDAAGAGGGG